MRTPTATAPPAAEVDITDFATLFDHEFEYVWNALRRLGVSERDLEDLTHEVFLLIHRHLDTYDSSRPLRPWLFGFARRVAADYRKQARHRIVLAADPAGLRAHDPGETSWTAEVESRDAVALVHGALDALDLDQRAVLILHDLEGYSIKVVAEALYINVNTAYSRLRLARARFRAVVCRMNPDKEVAR